MFALFLASTLLSTTGHVLEHRLYTPLLGLIFALGTATAGNRWAPRAVEKATLTTSALKTS